MITPGPGEITMVGTDGRVRPIPMKDIQERELSGWRIIVMPKEEYYPHLDVTNNPKLKIPTFLEENIQRSDLLEVKIL